MLVRTRRAMAAPGAEVICVHLALSLLDSFFLSLFDFMTVTRKLILISGTWER